MMQVTTAVEGVYRVESDGEIVGYVVEVGSVFVSLRGPVFNTSVEVGQSHDLIAAARLVLAA
jgi:hypothetical protein